MVWRFKSGQTDRQRDRERERERGRDVRKGYIVI